MWEKVIAAAMIVGLLFFMGPGMLARIKATTKQEWSDSFKIMGYLAVGLIAFISLCVFILRQS